VVVGRQNRKKKTTERQVLLRTPRWVGKAYSEKRDKRSSARALRAEAAAKDKRGGR